MKRYVLLIICVSLMAACSVFQKKTESKQVDELSSAKSEEELINEALADIDEEDVGLEEMKEQGVLEEKVSEIKQESFMEEESDRVMMQQEPKEKMAQDLRIYETGTYKVKEDESLMLISYKLYGDYLKWKEIAQLNPEKVKGQHMIKAGVTLKYYLPEKEFNWKKEGTPYLIKKGDYLSKISHNVYGKASRWREIWNHNKEMIKNPDLIFYGFTLYYLEDKGSDRGMASK